MPQARGLRSGNPHQALTPISDTVSASILRLLLNPFTLPKVCDSTHRIIGTRDVSRACCTEEDRISTFNLGTGSQLPNPAQKGAMILLLETTFWKPRKTILPFLLRPQSVKELQRRAKDVIRGSKYANCNFRIGSCCVAFPCHMSTSLYSRVRCSLTAKGAPCTNCVQDDRPCELIPRMK